MASEKELIQLALTKDEFDLLVGSHLAVATQASGRLNLAILTLHGAIERFLTNGEAVTSLNKKLSMISEAIKKEPEDCGNPDCPIHGTSEEAQELRRALDI